MTGEVGRRLSSLSRSVEGHVVLVTGAGSGIGRATAHLFADEGARVAVTDLDAASSDDVAAEVTAAGGDARAWALDVTDAAAVQGVVADVAAWGGG
ncbi:MAG: SDR family NAD(P)-dependent oxidoreductase, partial [Acidimicrobiales bacterium]|nr:SDR family NAD(P)-dependent oxidoreductase [Acidimicrobiales bacterium]